MTSLSDIVTIRVPRGIITAANGTTPSETIVANATVEERHNDELMITEHPIEQGAPIADHSYKRPNEVTLRYGWSPSLGNLLTSSFTNLSTPTDLKALYQKLIDIQMSRAPFQLITGKRKYKNMLIKSITETTDKHTENALLLTVVCREVIIVSTRATTLAEAKRRADPARTSEVSPQGVKQTQPATPSPGGAVPPEFWQ